MNLPRDLFAIAADTALADPTGEQFCTLYHVWFSAHRKAFQCTWLGIPTIKSPSDMWNYQEILTELRPSLVVEFGTACGGSAWFFASILQQLGLHARLLTVDTAAPEFSSTLAQSPIIERMRADSKSPEVTTRIAALREEYPGPAFFILDSCHERDHVLGELLSLRAVTRPGDRVIVEDGDIHGHPVWVGDATTGKEHGPGPWEAIKAYEERFPEDYEHDTAREHKFGWTHAPNGFLVRR